MLCRSVYISVQLILCISANRFILAYKIRHILQEIPLNLKSERPTQCVVVQSEPLKQPLKVPMPNQTSRLLAHRISGEADAFYASLACEMAVPLHYWIGRNASGVRSILENWISPKKSHFRLAEQSISTYIQRGVNLFELFAKHQPGVAGCGWLQPGRNFLST